MRSTDPVTGPDPPAQICLLGALSICSGAEWWRP